MKIHLTHCGLAMPHGVRFGLTLDQPQVMAWCLMAPSHNLTKSWLTIGKILENDMIAFQVVMVSASMVWNIFENYIFDQNQCFKGMKKLASDQKVVRLHFEMKMYSLFHKIDTRLHFNCLDPRSNIVATSMALDEIWTLCSRIMGDINWDWNGQFVVMVSS